MKKDTGLLIAKPAAVAASAFAAGALLLKFKKDNDTLTAYENEDDDDFGDIDTLDNINPDTTTREYVAINITGNSSKNISESDDTDMTQTDNI